MSRVTEVTIFTNQIFGESEGETKRKKITTEVQINLHHISSRSLYLSLLHSMVSFEHVCRQAQENCSVPSWTCHWPCWYRLSGRYKVWVVWLQFGVHVGGGGACGCTCGVLTCVTVGLVCVCVWSLYVCVCVYICMYVCAWSLCIVHTLLCDVLYWYSPHFIVWRFVHTLLCDVLYRYSPHLIVWRFVDSVEVLHTYRTYITCDVLYLWYLTFLNTCSSYSRVTFHTKPP